MLVLHQSLQHAAAPIAGFWLYWGKYTVIVWPQGSVMCRRSLGVHRRRRVRACFM